MKVLKLKEFFLQWWVIVILKNTLIVFYRLSDQTEDVSSVAVKRTMGMGDIVVSEPILRKLKQKYPEAKITYYTAKARYNQIF